MSSTDYLSKIESKERDRMIDSFAKKAEGDRKMAKLMDAYTEATIHTINASNAANQAKTDDAPNWKELAEIVIAKSKEENDKLDAVFTRLDELLRKEATKSLDRVAHKERSKATEAQKNG